MESSSAYEAGQASGQFFAIGLVAVALLGGGIFFVIAMIKATKHRTRGWIIGAIASGLVALCGLLGATGLAASSLGRAIKSNKTDAERKKRLASDDGRYRVEVPGHWKSMPALNEEAGIAAGNELREQYLIVIENPKSDYAGGLKAFDQLMVEHIGGSLENPEASDPEDRQIGQYPALHRRLTGTTSSIRLVYHLSSVETADAFYQIVMWTIPSRENAAKPVFREVVDSFSAKAGKPDPALAAAALESVAGDTRSQVVRIVVELLGTDPADVQDSARFIEDLGADSLDTVELVMAVEEEFEVEIPDETAEKLATVGDLIRWIDGQKGAVEK